MKIGILVSMINNFGEVGFYNSQEIGLAKALSAMGHSVVVYKLLKKGSEIPSVQDENLYEVEYHCVKNIGINGLVNTKILDKKINGLVFFSDTQLSVPKVYKWCQKNNIIFIPYVGVSKSHSTNKYKAAIINFLFRRNLRVFKQGKCFVKNESVKNELVSKGVQDVVFAPVGIDLDLLMTTYGDIDINLIKKKYGYLESDKIILFIGRLVEEKRPIELIKIFKQVHNQDDSFKLLIIGTGSLLSEMNKTIEEFNLKEYVKYIPKILNKSIWELYRICDCFVNLNKQEIFGMVLLEAMYYEAKVIAWHAPGPDYIIENHKSGFLVNDSSEMIDYILSKQNLVGYAAHRRIIECLTWKTTAEIFLNYIDECGGEICG